MQKEDFWRKTYMQWSVEKLLETIQHCHNFQQNVLVEIGDKKYSASVGLGVITASQDREGLILEIIMEKLKNANNID